MSGDAPTTCRARVKIPLGTAPAALDTKLGRAREEFHRMFGIWPSILLYPRAGGWHAKIGRFASNYAICPAPADDLPARTLVFVGHTEPSLQSALERDLQV